MNDYQLHMIKEKAIYAGYKRNESTTIIVQLVSQIKQLKSASLLSGGVDVRTKKMG